MEVAKTQRLERVFLWSPPAFRWHGVCVQGTRLPPVGG